MSPRFRLGGVLRARQAQETVAKGKVSNANAEAKVAALGVQARERALDSRSQPPDGSAMAFSAAVSARQAMASALGAAMGFAGLADQSVQESVEDLAAAATRRRALEKLAERHAITRRHTEDQAEQRAVDDLTTAAYARRAPDGSPGP